MIGAAELEAYFHEEIPLSRAMGVTVQSIDGSGVRLLAPLAANVNLHGTVFGGSISALGILAAWAVVHAGLAAEGLSAAIVIQRSAVDFLRPVHGDLEASSSTPAGDIWARFVGTLSRRGRARITVAATLDSGGEPVATFEGAFVAVMAADG